MSPRSFCRPPAAAADASPIPCSDLRGNALRGRLPNRWARLDALERLLLDRNQLSGPLPPSWNTLEELKYL